MSDVSVGADEEEMLDWAGASAKIVEPNMGRWSLLLTRSMGHRSMRRVTGICVKG